MHYVHEHALVPTISPPKLSHIVMSLSMRFFGRETIFKNFNKFDIITKQIM